MRPPARPPVPPPACWHCRGSRLTAGLPADVARVYNFYTFAGKGNPRDVVLSPSAVDFLRKHKMDFQKWIYEGVPFVDAVGERKLRAKYFPEVRRSPVSQPQRS